MTRLFNPEHQKLLLELALYALGLAALGAYYRAHLWHLLSEGSYPLLRSQSELIALAVASDRLASWLMARLVPAYVREPRPKTAKKSYLYTAALVVPVCVVPIFTLVDELIRSTTPTPIAGTLVASLMLVIPFAWIITLVYGLSMYRAMCWLNALKPWSLAAFGFSFMYVAFWGYPSGSDAIKCLNGAAIGVGVWLFVYMADRRLTKRAMAPQN